MPSQVPNMAGDLPWVDPYFIYLRRHAEDTEGLEKPPVGTHSFCFPPWGWKQPWDGFRVVRINKGCGNHAGNFQAALERKMPRGAPLLTTF